MSTTTLTGIGRHPSIRQSNRAQSHRDSSPQNLSSPIDPFPTFVDETKETVTSSNGQLPDGQLGHDDLWQPRKAGNVSWSHKPPSASKHRPRKSISETITTIRTRNASMSANAHDIAEALRAPISYKLIVRKISYSLPICCDAPKPRSLIKSSRPYVSFGI